MTKSADVFFKTLADESMIGILAFDGADRRCVYLNNIARETLEIEYRESGRYEDVELSHLYPGEDRQTFRGLSDDFMRHDGFYQDVLVRKSNDTQFIANVGLRHLHLPDQSPILLVMVQDITFQKKLQREIQSKQDEIKNAYTELLEQNRQLKELDLAKDKFIALTTHELRTPLSAIVATSEALVLKLFDTPEQCEDFIKTIHEQGLHLMELVNDVLDFAKIRAGKMEYYVEHCSLIPIIEKSVQNFGHMAEQAQIKMIYEPPVEGDLCYFDELRIREVVNNVVSNAIKYNKQGGEVRVFVERNPERTRIIVSDTGPGIPEDKRSAVFNEFEMVGNVSTHHKGTGLGMPISRRLMHAMGGDLTFDSVVGEGTRFYIDIPNEKVLPEEMYRARPDKWGDLAA